MKWKKENKAKVDGGDGHDESPEPPNIWSEDNLSWKNIFGLLSDWTKKWMEIMRATRNKSVVACCNCWWSDFSVFQKFALQCGDVLRTKNCTENKTWKFLGEFQFYGLLLLLSLLTIQMWFSDMFTLYHKTQTSWIVGCFLWFETWFKYPEISKTCVTHFLLGLSVFILI